MGVWQRKTNTKINQSKSVNMNNKQSNGVNMNNKSKSVCEHEQV